MTISMMILMMNSMMTSSMIYEISNFEFDCHLSNSATIRL